jgi:hypothetical protein
LGGQRFDFLGFAFAHKQSRVRRLAFASDFANRVHAGTLNQQRQFFQVGIEPIGVEIHPHQQDRGGR